jgi:hypothetical protein
VLLVIVSRLIRTRRPPMAAGTAMGGWRIVGIACVKLFRLAGAM